MYRNLLIKNTRICCNGSLIDKDELCVNGLTGLFENSLTNSSGEMDLETIDLENRIIAPAFIELQINGCFGVHFTNFEDEGTYGANLEMVSRYLVQKGVGGFYVTLPTVKADVFKKVRHSSSAASRKWDKVPGNQRVSKRNEGSKQSTTGDKIETEREENVESSRKHLWTSIGRPCSSAPS